MRQTKIVATIGPASDAPEMLEKLIRAGVDVARLNFSHGSHAEHRARLQRIRAVGQAVGKFVPSFLTRKGLKYVLDPFAHGPVHLQPGQSSPCTAPTVWEMSAASASLACISRGCGVR